jgi:hypothetical protein
MKSLVLSASAAAVVVLVPALASATFLSPDTAGVTQESLENPTALNPWLYADGNPTRYTDPTGLAVCHGRDEAACRALFAQAVRLHGALSSFSEKAVIQGSGGEVLSIEPSGGFGGLEFLPSTSSFAISVDIGSPSAGNLGLEPISERTLAGLVGIFERFKRTGGFGAPGSPESNAFAKGALEGLSLQNPAEAGGLLDPSALFLTDKVLLGLSGSQMEMFQRAVAGHNQFLQHQYMGGYMLAATTVGLSIGLPGAAGADAAADMDMAMMLRANELSNAQTNSSLASTANQQAYTNAMGQLLDGGYETYFRTMSIEDYQAFLRTQKLQPTTETFISPTQSFSEGYQGVLVKFDVAPGTTANLRSIGVRAHGARPASMFPEMPQARRGWGARNALFKVEGKQTNIGLGTGRALDLFNDSIRGYEVIGVIQ